MGIDFDRGKSKSYSFGKTNFRHKNNLVQPLPWPTTTRNESVQAVQMRQSVRYDYISLQLIFDL